jgi:hypothetical protein
MAEIVSLESARRKRAQRPSAYAPLDSWLSRDFLQAMGPEGEVVELPCDSEPQQEGNPA